MTEQGEYRGTPGREAEDVPPRMSEEQARALEEELRKVRVEDLLLQSVASVVNLTARRIGKEDERDLEQARSRDRGGAGPGRPAPDEATPQVREALSELQMLYAQAAEGEPPDGERGERAPQSEPAPPSGAEQPGRAQRPSASRRHGCGRRRDLSEPAAQRVRTAIDSRAAQRKPETTSRKPT